MFSAATRLIALAAMIFIAASCSHAVKGAAATPSPTATATALTAAQKVAPPAPLAPSASVRAAPARPVPAPTLPAGVRIGGFDYVSATDIAVWLGLKGAWTEPLRKLALIDKTNADNRAELNAESRDTLVNGRRVLFGNKTVLRSGHLYVSRIDAERCLAPLLRPGFGVALPAPPRVIAIDPGHGGKFTGTDNKHLGLREQDMTLDVALRLRKTLEATGYKVVMTRTADVELAPELTMDWLQRSLIANRAGADLFVSIHFNSLFPDTKTSGTEVFTFPPQYQRSDQSWGEVADDTEKEAVPVNRFDHWSVVLAGALHRDLLETLKTADRGKKLKHLAVLRGLNCPGVLVESAFLSNDAEARRVATPAFRQQIADALAAGIRDYAATLDSLRPKSQSAGATSATPPTSTPR